MSQLVALQNVIIVDEKTTNFVYYCTSIKVIARLTQKSVTQRTKMSKRASNFGSKNSDVY